MKKKVCGKAVLWMVLGVLVLAGLSFWHVRSNETTKTENSHSKSIMRVASGNKVSCLNIWGADGSASSAPMTIYYAQSDGGIQAPQIIYLRDENVNTVFCIQYGSALSSGNLIEVCSKEAYQRLNEQQKKKIAQVLGTAAVKYAPRDGEGGYNVRNTGACTMDNFRLYNSTQLMIWYCIDQYSGRPGSGATGGITWEGVVRTCQAGWGNQQECERIRSVLEHAEDILGFGAGIAEQAPEVELVYNGETDAYETIVTDTEGHLDQYQLTDAVGLECIRCNEQGIPAEDGQSVLIRSQEPFTAGSVRTLTWQKTVPGGSLWYLSNKSQPQDLVYYAGGNPSELVSYLKVYTQPAPEVLVEKLDAENETRLSGVQLQLYEEETLLGEWTTTEDTYKIENLRMGHTYRIHEVSAPEGYEVTEDVMFTVTEQTQVIQVKNARIYGEATLVKQDKETGKSLEGAVFLLYEESTNRCIGTYTTDIHGEILVKKLPYGTYYMIEQKAPENYQSDERNYVFEIRKQGEHVRISVPNARIPETTTEVTTEATTEEHSEETTENTESTTAQMTEATEHPTLVAGAKMEKQTSPVTGDQALPMLVFGMLVLCGSVYSVMAGRK